MWKYLGFQSPSQINQSKDPNEQPPENTLKELKKQLEEKMNHLTKLFQHSEQFMQHHYQTSQQENTMNSTLGELVSIIEGLVNIVAQLRAEYLQVRDHLQEHQQVKQMLNNHQTIIADIQESHSHQVARIYEDKRACQKELNDKISALEDKNEELQRQFELIGQKLQEKMKENQILKSQTHQLLSQNQELERTLSETTIKYKAISGLDDQKLQKKVIDPRHIQLQYIFYYSKLRENIISFLDIRELSRLQSTGKFYHLTLRRQQSKFFFRYFKKQFERRLTTQIRNAKFYEKIYELFPVENVKISAFKYLYFKIKPATYILPYLQEEQLEHLKQDHQEKEKEQTKFSWRTLFHSDKGKDERKEENRFSLSQLKNQEQFKKIEHKIEGIFKHIFQIKLPEDIVYFSQAMEKQLQELKTELSEHKSKGGQTEWTAQLFCLARYMYHEINELYNLLQVIFGELLSKNKQHLSLRENYDYLKQNELVLRNLIENLSNDKANMQKKLLISQGEVLKNKLERQAVANSIDRLNSEHAAFKKKHEAVVAEHAQCSKNLETYQSYCLQMENKLKLIHEELEELQKIPGKSRTNSFASANEEESAGHESLES